MFFKQIFQFPIGISFLGCRRCFQVSHWFASSSQWAVHNTPICPVMLHSEIQHIRWNPTEIQDLNIWILETRCDLLPQFRWTLADIMPNCNSFRSKAVRIRTRNPIKILRFKVHAENAANIIRTEDVKIHLISLSRLLKWRSPIRDNEPPETDY